MVLTQPQPGPDRGGRWLRRSRFVPELVQVDTAICIIAYTGTLRVGAQTIY